MSKSWRTVSQDPGEADPTPAEALPPGPARRRALRVAGINLTLADFTAEEREHRGFGFEHRGAADTTS